MCSERRFRLGLDPLTAIQMVTFIRPEFFPAPRQGRDHAGLSADLVVLEDLESFLPEKVYKDGRLVALHGKNLGFPSEGEKNLPCQAHHDPFPLRGELQIRKEGSRERVIEVIPGQILTWNGSWKSPRSTDG